MNRQQSGFTMIELIAVIVILGILAATAVPRFINMSGAARQAATDNIAGSIESASALNYAGALAVDAGLSVAGTPPQSVTACDNANLDPIMVGGVPAGYTVSGAAGPLTLGQVGACTLTASSGETAAFSIYGAP